MIRQVTAEEFAPAWKHFYPKIRKALSGDEIAAAALYTRILNGYAQMWLVRGDEGCKACAIVSIGKTPSCTKLIVEVLAGEGLSEWSATLTEFLSDIKDIIGAKSLEASCRPGLAKYLKNEGWKVQSIIMEKF